jgi:hypothetical protein
MRFTITPVFNPAFGFKVYVPQGFELYEKEKMSLPTGFHKLHPDITWFGTFGLRVREGPTPRKLIFKYEIQAAKIQPERKAITELVFWDGEFIIPLTEEFHDVREIEENGVTYIRAKLSLTDPPCGWR